MGVSPKPDEVLSALPAHLESWRQQVLNPRWVEYRKELGMFNSGQEQKVLTLVLLTKMRHIIISKCKNAYKAATCRCRE